MTNTKINTDATHLLTERMKENVPQYMRKQVQKLLDSDITANKIQVDTGVDRGIISRLRNDKAKIDNLRFGKMVVLYNYANKHCKL